MKVTIVSPLFPPDVAESAVYVKELATRLSKLHEVEVLTYGHLPEAVTGVSVHAVDKRTPVLFRLLSFTRALMKALRTSDALIIQNGPSVELPLVIARWFSRTPYVFYISDESAHSYAHRRALRKTLQTTACAHACTTLRGLPLPRPEKLPFREIPQNIIEAYEASWADHIEKLNRHLMSATT